MLILLLYLFLKADYGNSKNSVGANELCG